MARPAREFWNDGEAPALYPGLNDRDEEILNYVEERAESVERLKTRRALSLTNDLFPGFEYLDDQTLLKVRARLDVAADADVTVAVHQAGREAASLTTTAAALASGVELDDPQHLAAEVPVKVAVDAVGSDDEPGTGAMVSLVTNPTVTASDVVPVRVGVPGSADLDTAAWLPASGTNPVQAVLSIPAPQTLRWAINDGFAVRFVRPVSRTLVPESTAAIVFDITDTSGDVETVPNDYYYLVTAKPGEL